MEFSLIFFPFSKILIFLGKPVSCYLYQCIIKCPITNERLTSNSIKVPVSTFTLPDKSLPEFKIALLICQEEYEKSDCFHTLQAPRTDGKALIKALHVRSLI